MCLCSTQHSTPYFHLSQHQRGSFSKICVQQLEEGSGEGSGSFEECSGPGALINENGICTCDGDDFSIMSENVPGLCVCDIEQQSFVINNVCRTCIGVGNLVQDNDDYKCVCGNNAALSWETIGFICSCNIGYLEGDDNNCYKCDNGVFNPADQT